MSPGLVRAIAAVIPAAFLLAGLLGAAPFQDDVDPVRSKGEDWLTYKRNAVSILHGGLSMPAVEGPYRRPGGFLYNYFLAGVFAVAGVNSSFAYVVQSALLGVAISMLFLTFRGFLSPPWALLFVVGLTATMVVDFWRVYVFRLLSENLFVVLAAASLWCILRAHEHRQTATAGIAGVVVGAAILTRPNVVLFGPAVALLLFTYAPRRGARLAVPTAFCIGLLAVLALIPLRNYVAGGAADIAVLTYTGDWMKRDSTGAAPQAELSLENVRTTAVYYGRRVLFAFGWTTALAPQYRVRYHWLAMWVGFASFLGLVTARRRLEFWQALVVAYVVLYLAPLVAVAMITNYGFRMIVPVIPAVWLATVYAGEQLARLTRSVSSTQAR